MFFWPPCGPQTVKRISASCNSVSCIPLLLQVRQVANLLAIYLFCPRESEFVVPGPKSNTSRKTQNESQVEKFFAFFGSRVQIHFATFNLRLSFCVLRFRRIKFKKFSNRKMKVETQDAKRVETIIQYVLIMNVCLNAIFYAICFICAFNNKFRHIIWYVNQFW